MQGISQEVSETKSVYSHWNLSVQSWHFRKCGLYEAGDFTWKSRHRKIWQCEVGRCVNAACEVVGWWITKCCWKSHTTIQTLKKSLRTNFLTPFIPRDQQDWKMFISTTLWETTVGMAKMLMATGSTQSSRNRLPNNKLCPRKEAQRADYHYSLILLFVPFQMESSLLPGGNKFTKKLLQKGSASAR